MAQGFGSSGGVAFALTTGVVTAFNACGFAMLPAYVSYFVGTTSHDDTPHVALRLRRAFVVGAVVTLGFVTVFGILGLAASSLQSTIKSKSAYMSMGVGAVLLLLGVAMIRGYEPKLSFIKVGPMKQGSSLRSMYVFGLSYALISMSCGFGGFFTTVGSAVRQNSFGRAMLQYVAFSAGMGLVLMVLAVAAALAQQAFIRSLKKVLPHINRISGVLLTLAALYLLWYGWFEYRTIVQGKDASDRITGTTLDASSRIQQWVNNLPTSVVVAALVAVLGCFAAVLVYTKRPKPVSTSASLTSPTRTPQGDA